MTKAEIIGSVIISIAVLGIAIKILSDRIAERKVAHRNLKTAIAVGFGLYSAFALATILEYCCAAEFKIWEVALLSFSILCILISTAAMVGMYKGRKDERKRLKVPFNNSCMTTNENAVEKRGNKVANCEIIEIENYRK